MAAGERLSRRCAVAPARAMEVAQAGEGGSGCVCVSMAMQASGESSHAGNWYK